MKTNRTYYYLSERCAWVGMVVNFSLCFIKLWAAYFGNSKGMMADAIHSLSDLISSGIIIVGLKIAKKPADEEHPYGHARAEAIFAKVVAILLILFGLEVSYVSLKAIFVSSLKPLHLIALMAAIFSIVVKESLFRYTLQIGNKLSSTILITSAWDHRSDALSSLAALIGILLTLAGYPLFDPLAGIFVSGLIIKTGISMFHQAYDELMNGVIEDEIMDKIRRIIGGISEIKSIRGLKAYKAGSEINIDLTISINGKITVDEGHKICNSIEKTLKKEIGFVNQIMIHVHPY
ncbi:cation diffusion facilitator family transporter [bacterium]|nr:cation diffusion facilitator family transporter [bacterium]MBU0899931.1 cation diffusion facilitator family transporter [bacterium]MBU1154141.1 cation diffusion facilitator family transporter [bacterium]MBU1782205.1 cation diffusion facilitator family transporter [bacterium]MBU2600010.1 cation diffusion facilitator family transporter [bacterium]